MKVVVVGAGYAGTIAANRLAKKVPGARITVVNPRCQFIERVRLHEQIAGTGRADTPLRAMLRSDIRLCETAAKKIGDGGVSLESGQILDYDYLILAVGSTVAPLPGTVPVGTWEGAREARARIETLAPGATVTVVGGGLTGIETAAEIAYGCPHLHVNIVAPAIGTSLSLRAAARTRTGLQRLGVVSISDTVTRIDQGTVEDMGAGRDRVVLMSGGDIVSDLTLWAMIGTVPDLAIRSGLDVDEAGRALVDPYLRSISDDRIFVVGDCAAVPGARAACATATPQGAHAADSLARLLRGREPKPYSMGYTGQALSLGRRDGVVMSSKRDDTPRRLFFAGRGAAVAKEGVSRYAKYGSRTATYGWIRGPK